MEAIFYVIFIVLIVLVVLAIVSVIRGAFRPPETKPDAAAVKPFIDFPPPPEVTPTGGVARVGHVALAWSVLNLTGVVVYLAMGMQMGDTFSKVPIVVRITMTVYLLVAAVYAGLGGIFLLSAKAAGRRLLSWSGFLFATLVLLLFAMALLAWHQGTTLEGRRTAMYASAGLLVHLLIDTILASSAQRVGLPANAKAMPRSDAPHENAALIGRRLLTLWPVRRYGPGKASDVGDGRKDDGWAFRNGRRPSRWLSCRTIRSSRTTSALCWKNWTRTRPTSS